VGKNRLYTSSGENCEVVLKFAIFVLDIANFVLWVW